ncbi:MAG: hypothetical protein QGG75_18600, partial [Alphaproteobacteria bacterium]|nr:hypothetical protein [Alphaproteobacteria bacterium]
LAPSGVRWLETRDLAPISKVRLPRSDLQTSMFETTWQLLAVLRAAFLLARAVPWHSGRTALR